MDTDRRIWVKDKRTRPNKKGTEDPSIYLKQTKQDTTKVVDLVKESYIVHG